MTDLRLPTYETMLIEAISSLVVDAGIVTTPAVAGGNSLADATKSWQAGVHTNRLIRIVKGHGAGQMAFIAGNSRDSLIIRGGWLKAVAAGDAYAIINADLMQMLRDVFGGGANINAGNPLPVDATPGPKATNTILDLANIAAGATSALAQCTAIDLGGGESSLALTIVATFNAAATRGLRVHVRTSPDNVDYDTEDWDAWEPDFIAGATIRVTEVYDVSPVYARVLIENLDAAQAITGVSVVASIGP